MNDLTAQLLTELLAEQRKTNALLLEVIEATKQARFGGKVQEQYDIVITVESETFTLEFKLRFAKDNPEKATANKELKNLIQKSITAGLGENKHYIIAKETKTSKDGSKSWQEWKFVFTAQYAAAIGLRIEAAIKDHGAKVKGLDDLATLAQSVSQVELAAPKANSNPAHNDQMKHIHAVGGEYTRLYFAEGTKWDTVRFDFAEKQLGKRVESYTEYTAAQLDKLIHTMLMLIVGNHGNTLYKTDWLRAKEADFVKWVSKDRTTVLGDLSIGELHTLRDTLARKIAETMPAEERRL